MISKELQHVRDYEKSESASVPKEERPVFHFSPRTGWLNDPNGFSYYKGEYHLFYQYHPYSSYWGPMHWGHAVSKDLISWEYLPAAMAPDTDYDGAGCFSGTAITLPDGRQLLMYPGCGDNSKDPLCKGRWLQTQCVAVSEEQEKEPEISEAEVTETEPEETITGEEIKDQGPAGFANSKHLSGCLRELGFEVRRFKTGTPPRLDGYSIDYNKFEVQKGDRNIQTFSFLTKRANKNTRVCYLGYTTEKTKQIILDNLDRAPMYSGVIQGLGPRYCPSIETKIVRFADKDRHQIFLEPETNDNNQIYVQGMSTSMPKDVQHQMIESISGLEHAKFEKYGYAIEYDCINPLELYPTLETKKIKNLFCAGQINGTSGYEEAAAQGLLAGLNASLTLRKKEQIILSPKNNP